MQKTQAESIILVGKGVDIVIFHRDQCKLAKKSSY